MADVTTSSYDVVVVGGGTAGALVATRLAEHNPSVALVEWGPDDEHKPQARDLSLRDQMLQGEYDLDYLCKPNQRGNLEIRLARLRILGGCSTANTMIAWCPLRADLEEWVLLGAAGWDPDTALPSYDWLRTDPPGRPGGSQPLPRRRRGQRRHCAGGAAPGPLERLPAR